MRDLAAEIRTFLSSSGPSTATEIAMGIRARRTDVQGALRASDAFRVVGRPLGASTRAFHWNLSRPVLDGQSGTNGAASQSARIVMVLRDGKAHTTAEIHAAAGFSRMNSRIAELRGRGYVIETVRIEGVPAGPHAQAYVLVATPESVAGEAA